MFSMADLAGAGETPGSPQECVVYVAQALARLVTVIFGRVFSVEPW